MRKGVNERSKRKVENPNNGVKKKGNQDRHRSPLILPPEDLSQQHLPAPSSPLVLPHLLRLIHHRLVSPISREIHAHSTPRKGRRLFRCAAPVPGCRVQGARNASPSDLPLLGRGRALVTHAALVVLTRVLLPLSVMVDEPVHETAGKVPGLAAAPLFVVAVLVVRVRLKDGNSWG